MKLLATLHPDREIPGKLELLDGGECGAGFGPIDCLGRSDDHRAFMAGNPHRSPLQRYGDVPCGVYRATIEPAGERVDVFGPYERLLLAALSGDALTAKQNGRTELMLHGGDPAKGGTRGGLRPTYGCIRVTNPGMKRILEAMRIASMKEIELEVKES